MVFTNNWKLETDYSSTRSQLFFFDYVYSTVSIGAMTISNHVGINNAFVTSTLGASVIALSGAT